MKPKHTLGGGDESISRPGAAVSHGESVSDRAVGISNHS